MKRVSAGAPPQARVVFRVQETTTVAGPIPPSVNRLSRYAHRLHSIGAGKQQGKAENRAPSGNATFRKEWGINPADRDKSFRR